MINLYGRLKKPTEIKDKKEAKMWRDIVGSYAPDYFNHGDTPLIINYIRAKVMADRAYEELQTQGNVVEAERGPVANPNLKIWKDSSSILASLSTKLRLAPNGRTRPEDGKQANRKMQAGKVFDPNSDWRSFQTESSVN